MLFKIKNLEFKLNNKVILGKQNISLKDGDHLLILGPSGCGKTTLLNLMSGLLKLTQGEIMFENKSYANLSNENIDNLRGLHFGFIFQKLHLINHLTVEQNIALAIKKPKKKLINDLLKKLDLSQNKKKLARDLSFGEAQRVAIARGVANQPKVIFADEPTSALDDNNAKQVIDLLLSYANRYNSTVIASTHDLRIQKFFKNTLEIKI